jgi:hypothetical protein
LKSSPFSVAAVSCQCVISDAILDEAARWLGQLQLAQAALYGNLETDHGTA